MKQFADFAVETLVPAARAVLLRRYEEHRKGADIGIENKGDGSPASKADREAEEVMRKLIKKEFPAHGIIGEEYGLENPGAEYVWVLDPLDGTRQFLDMDGEWGTLIALMRNGKPVVGIVDDAVNNVTWRGEAGGKGKKPANGNKNLAKASIACTRPEMFSETPWEKTAPELFKACGKVEEKLNCLGFTYVADGTIDAAAEGNLKLHDIAALLPVLWQAGADAVMPNGTAYSDYVFDLKAAEKSTYTLITAHDPALVKQVCAILEKK